MFKSTLEHGTYKTFWVDRPEKEKTLVFDCRCRELADQIMIGEKVMGRRTVVLRWEAEGLFR